MVLLQSLRQLIFGVKKQSPKFLQERKDASLAIFCSILRRLKLEQQNINNSNVDDALDLLDNQKYDPKKNIDDAVSILEQRLHDESTIKDVRTELQHEFEPQVMQLFQSFLEANNDSSDRSFVQSNFDKELKEIKFMKESNLQFHRQKALALKEIEKTNDHFRMRNVAYGASLRKRHGYNAVTFQSSIEGESGNGLFIDGKASLGSIISFVPGYVWLHEHMRTPKSLNHFMDDANYQLTARPDGMLVDARPFDTLESKIPYFLPSQRDENPWAHGHLINHPTKGNIPNCISIMFNYCDNMDDNLRSFVPNLFSKEPSVIGKGMVDLNYFVSALMI